MPSLSYDSLEEALSDIRAVRAAGPEKEHNYNYDYVNIYEMDHIYVLEEVPPQFGCKQVPSVILGPNGIRLSYCIEVEYVEDVAFMWCSGMDKEERIEAISQNFFELERYQDTEFYFGYGWDDIFIYWWKDDDEYTLKYTKDIEISPEELIDYLDVVRYDF